MHARLEPEAGTGAAIEPSATIGRLKKRAEFLAVGKDGRRIHSGHMSVQGRRRRDEERPVGLRVGLTVTKREGHATERNRIRRRLRAAVATLADDASAREALDLVLLGRRAALSAPFPSLVADLRRAFDRMAEPSGSRSSERRRHRTDPDPS